MASVKSASVRAVAATMLVLVAVAAEARGSHHPRRFTDPDLDAALVVDARTSTVLFARNAEAIRHPASLTKMMTLYLLFEQLRQHKIALTTELPVSANAAKQPRSHLRLRAGDTISVDMAIKSVVVCSANDATVALAESLGGSEQHFAGLMNAKAKQFGMNHSVFRNATGLPDDAQVTTAQDLSILARHLIYDFPDYFAYFGTARIVWRGEEINTHDMLIGNYRGADGIKTGYIDSSGYNLVSTAQRDGTRLIAVLMGGLTADRRDEAMVGLLDDGFARSKQKPDGRDSRIQ